MGILTAILSFLTSLFNGGFERFINIFEPTLEQKREENQKSVEEEFRGIEKGERPKWDV